MKKTTAANRRADESLAIFRAAKARTDAVAITMHGSADLPEDEQEAIGRAWDRAIAQFHAATILDRARLCGPLPVYRLARAIARGRALV